MRGRELEEINKGFVWENDRAREGKPAPRYPRWLTVRSNRRLVGISKSLFGAIV